MCGVFGYIARNDKPVRIETLQRIASVTQARGPHAWGMSWIDADNRLHMFKQSGPIRDSLGLLGMACGARLLIGHCRYATHGEPADNMNNHPHPADGGWIVHNGVIRDHANIADDYGLYPMTDCDSEVLGLLIAERDGKMIDRVAWAVKTVKSRPLVMLGLWKPGRLIVARRGNPLHKGETASGTYLGSLASGLPGTVKEIADETVLQYTLKGGYHAAV